MRVFILATAALAASALASAPAAAQVRAEVIQKSCSDMTFNQIGLGLADLMEKYEFSANPEEAEQQAIGLLCPPQAAALEQRPSAAIAPTQQAVVTFPPPSATTFPPPPRQRLLPPPPHRMMPPVVVIPRLPPPPPGGYGMRAPTPRVATVGGYGYQEQYREEHYRSSQSRPRPLPLTSSVRGEAYCMATTDPERFVSERPAPHASCQIGPIPGKPCPGWVCQRR